MVHIGARDSVAASGLQRADAMPEPTKRIPEWLTTDVLVTVVALAIILVLGSG